MHLDNHENSTDLNLSDLDLTKLKLSDKDAVALSYLTPGLSRRIQRQLLSQLPPSQARKLSRTLSMQDPNESRPKYQIQDSHSLTDNTRRPNESRFGIPPRIIPRHSEKQRSASDLATRPADQNTVPDRPSVGKEFQPINTIRSDFLNRRSLSYDPNHKSQSELSSIGSSYLEPDCATYRSSSRDRFSPVSESLSTDLSSRSDAVDIQNILPGIHNSDLTASDRRLLENYRKSREHRRALRSSSILDSGRTAHYKPPLPVKESDYSQSDSSRSDAMAYGTSTDRSVLSKYLSPTSSTFGYSSTIPETSRNRSSSLHDGNDILKTRTLDRRLGQRKISRFLRPDFYDTPAEESTFIKEKNEREQETQKVLKEIRDKRLKRRLGLRQASPVLDSAIPSKVEPTPTVDVNHKIELSKEIPTPKLSAENDKIDVAATKSRIAKLIRPKSYPEKRNSPQKKLGNESNECSPSKESSPKKDKLKTSPEKTSKMLKIKKSTPPPTGSTETTGNVELNTVEKPSNKNKFLQSLEKKFEKLRAFSNSEPNTSDDADKASRVGNAIRRLREQSLPRTTEHITESGLIKRAVSVEDISGIHTIGNENPKVSRKSVSKILGLFKKYEDKDSAKIKKAEKASAKSKKSDKTNDVENSPEKKEKKLVRKISKPSSVEAALPDATKLVKKTKLPSKTGLKKESSPIEKELDVGTAIDNNQIVEAKKNDVKPESKMAVPTKLENRVGSTTAIPTKSENGVMAPTENSTLKPKILSKLPVNMFRRSLDLEKVAKKMSPPKETRKSLDLQQTAIVENKLLNGDVNDTNGNTTTNVQKRKSLQLDFSKLPRLNTSKLENNGIKDDTIDAVLETKGGPIIKVEPIISNGIENTMKDAFVPTEKNEVRECLSPRDESELSCDDWSVCSDYGDHIHNLSDFSSPVSPSGDENESVIDRIRRKSFYSRFNEKKKTRKSSLVGPGADYNINYRAKPPYRKENPNKINLEPLSPLKFRLSDRKTTDYSTSPLAYSDNKSLYSQSKSLTDTYKKYDVENYIRRNSLLKEPLHTKTYIPSGSYHSKPNVKSYPDYTEHDETHSHLSGAGDVPSSSGVITRLNSCNNTETSMALSNNNIEITNAMTANESSINNNETASTT